MTQVKRVPDTFSRQAHARGFLARSVFKLEEINQKFKVLRPTTRVIDFGAAPGSWTQFVAQMIGPQGRITAVDLQPLKFRSGNVTPILADIFHVDPLQLCDNQLNSFHTVLSDAAPSTTGNAPLDSIRSVELCLHIAWVSLGGFAV